MRCARSCCLGMVVLCVAGSSLLFHAAEQQTPGDDILKKIKIPPAPVLTPQEALKSFKLAPGFRIELVANEPLVNDPVALTFDADGRIWVCEMRGYMPDVDGKNEKAPIGRIVVLEDTDGDGRADKRTVFLDKLVLPRALCWTSREVLVCENGKLWSCRDLDGDLRCDEQKFVCEFGAAGNPEHAGNGLMPALDNWLYNAKEGVRFRKFGEQWVRESTVARGQWGITQDDYGRLYYNANGTLIRGDLAPCWSPNIHVFSPLTNVVLYKEQYVWPIRVNPGVNRGYLPNILRPDGTLQEVTANCGPVIYRGDNLPKALYGNVFICEPAGNLVRRNVFVEEDGKRWSKNAYERAEFLASTDERFRPVNAYNGPDGTLYLVDLYRGIIQHRAFVTPFLRKQILERGLEQPVHLGRIYRVVHETTQPRKLLAMSKLTSGELVPYLSDANGWRRDMAQQLLVQRNDKTVVPELKKLAAKGTNPLGRLHALWTLEGMGRLSQEFLVTLLADEDSQVRASAVFLCRPFVRKQPEITVIQELAELGKDRDKDVRMQVVFTLGLVNDATADRALEPSLKAAAGDATLLESLVAGFAGLETEFLAARLAQPAWAKAEPWREKLLSACATLLWRQRNPLAVLRLLHLAGGQAAGQEWQQVALLEGMNAPPAKGGFKGKKGLFPRLVTLPTAPEPLEKLRNSPNTRLASAAEALAKLLNWPGKDGKPLPMPPPLSAKHQGLYELGRKEYQSLCAACHHPAGFGEPGKGPALLDADWLGFSEERLARLVLHGLRGPITINDEPYNRDGALEMPGMAQALDDQKIAGILTYVRREWGDFAPPVEPETVARIRAATSGRQDQWTEKELLKIK